MRQWDTKKEFKADYPSIARLVFLGWLRALAEPNWGYALAALGGAVSRLLGHLFAVLLALSVLLLSPVTFPLFCFMHRQSLRKQRLNYLRRNRAADEDI